MEITNPLALLGNIVALSTLTWKTIYDLVWNPRLFHREIEIVGEIDAAKQKRRRADITTAITFLLLGISYAIFILEVLLK